MTELDRAIESYVQAARYLDLPVGEVEAVVRGMVREAAGQWIADPWIQAAEELREWQASEWFLSD